MPNLPIRYSVHAEDSPYGHRKGDVSNVDAPKSALNKMREWLDDNNRLSGTSPADIVAAIVDHYPGGMAAWAQEHGYTTDVDRIEQ